MSTGTGFAQPISGSAGRDRNQRKEQRADRVDVHDRVERQPAEQPRRRIAEPVRRPRVRRFVQRQRATRSTASESHDLDEIEVRQSASAYHRAAARRRLRTAVVSVAAGTRGEVGEDRVGARSADQRHQVFARRPADAGDRLPNRRQQLACAAARRRRRWSSSSDAKSRLRPRLPMKASRRSGAPRRGCAAADGAPGRAARAPAARRCRG